jgi:hypothetical protein
MMLSQAFALINPPEAEKTAAATPSSASSSTPSSSDAAAAGLRQALKEATADAEASTKTAAQASPIDDLTKLAASVVADEHEATVKEAQLYGAAVCDGFMARLAQYDAAAQKHAGAAPEKTAAIASVETDTFEKFASENPDLVREAHDLGYEQTCQALNKLAEAAWIHGHNGTVQWIHKTASDSFVAGFAAAAKLIEAAR